MAEEERPSDDADQGGRSVTPTGVHLAQLVGTVSGGLLGSLAGPLGALGGSAAGQAVMIAAAERVINHRQENAFRALAYGAAFAGVSEPELVERMSGDAPRLQLLGGVVEASMQAIAEEKLRALGRVLANASMGRDDAALNIDMLLAHALRDLEAPHLRVLNQLVPRRWAPVDNEPTRFAELGPRMSTKELQAALPPLAPGMHALVAILDGHGLVEKQPIDWNQALGGPFPPTNSDEPWRITSFGLSMILLIESAGALIDPQ